MEIPRREHCNFLLMMFPMQFMEYLYVMVIGMDLSCDGILSADVYSKAPMESSLSNSALCAMAHCAASL